MASFYNEARTISRELLPIVFDALRRNKFAFTQRVQRAIKSFFIKRGYSVEFANFLINRVQEIYRQKVVFLLKEFDLPTTRKNIERVIRQGLYKQTFVDLKAKDVELAVIKAASNKIERNFTLAALNNVKSAVIDFTDKNSKRESGFTSGQTIVVYLPSSADENRLAHERFYNKVMSLRACTRIQNVPNCQCGRVILGYRKGKTFIPKGTTYKRYLQQIKRLKIEVIDD